MKAFFSFLYLVLLQTVLRAQPAPEEDLARVIAYFENNTAISVSPGPRLEKSVNFFQLCAFVPLFFYQKVLSEQLSANCEFDQSCSNFAIQAVKGTGPLRGVLLSTDRLTRCNGQSQLETENHLINPVSGKTIDEAWMYRFND